MSDKVKGARPVSETGGAEPVRSVVRPEELGAPERVVELSATGAIKPARGVSPSEDPRQDQLAELDAKVQHRLTELIDEVERVERAPGEAWDEALLLALTSSLNVPQPVAERLLPRLKLLLENDPEAGRALKERLMPHEP